MTSATHPTSPVEARAGASLRGRVDDPVFAERYRAMSSRDARFDGQFITGVHSTGIYCRPSCPAMTPKPGNVSFYLTAAAAHEAGLRACKRCLPDAVPGSPAWNIRDDLAARAMRLIGDGTVEREGVLGLARRLGYTPRHLARVLVTEVGAGPLALARAHRAQTARVLLTSTDLPVTDVAFAAGFGSVRQFNDTITAVYERTPSALRAGARLPGAHGSPVGHSAAPGSSIRLLLPARAPFDGRGLVDFLGVRAVAGVERSTAAGYERTVRLPHGGATLQLSLAGTAAAPAVACVARLDNLADLAPLVSRVRRLFDLDADAQAIDRALADDPALAGSVRHTPGIRVPGSLDPEETLFRALLGQQVSVASARTALGRLSAVLGEPVTGSASPGGPLHGGPGPLRPGPTDALDLTVAPALFFPTAASIAVHGRDVLRGPAARVDAIVGVAEALAAGDLVLDVGESRDDLQARLTALPGIGPWTAGYVAMRVLGSPDILLTSDLALRQGADRIGLPARAADLAAHGIRWAPWRSYAGMHLWRAAGDPRPAGQNGAPARGMRRYADQVKFAHLRVEGQSTPRLAIVVDDTALFVDEVVDDAPRDLQELIEKGAPEFDRVRALTANALTHGASLTSIDDLRHSSAVLRPPQIIAIGANYAAHSSELKLRSETAATVFSLWPNSLTGHESIVTWPTDLTTQVDYEAELGVIIGRPARNVSVRDALDYVFGYTVVNDITARDLQFSEAQWSRCKSFDGFTPTGPLVVTADEIADPQDLWLTTHVDGRILQDASSGDMVRTVAEIISYLSLTSTLMPGTLISTGSPGGAGYSRKPQVFLKHGSTVTVSIDRIGLLTTHCREI